MGEGTVGERVQELERNRTIITGHHHRHAGLGDVRDSVTAIRSGVGRPEGQGAPDELGKSTAINLLCNQKRLAFASKTPGRTQHINYFSVGPKDEPKAHVVDLPGYGYAEVSGNAKLHWQQLLSTYLQSRAQLVGMILMMDSRRPLTELDKIMLDWFAPTGKPIHEIGRAHV